MLLNLGLVAAVLVLWVKMHRPAKEDPRLSKGLQLLQSKIAILEDLSDKSETQFKQLTALLESKIKDVTTKIQQADQQVQAIQMAMEKSMEVAKIFQDKIPHQEIIERQNTIKYVKAAKLAHQGMAVEDIAKQVELSKGELEFICKVNRDQLMFNEEQLPSWVKSEITQEIAADPDNFFPERDMSSFFEVPQADEKALKKLGDDFRKAKMDAEKSESTSTSVLHNFFFEEEPEMVKPAPEAVVPPAPPTPAPKVEAAAPPPPVAEEKPKKPRSAPTTSIGNGIKHQDVRPVQFRKIDLSKNLG
jgi:hypothetical protein